MALIKAEYQGYKIVTGDDEIDAEMASQLTLDNKELAAAINAENLADRLFARVLKGRTKSHALLCEKIPGANAPD